MIAVLDWPTAAVIVGLGVVVMAELRQHRQDDRLGDRVSRLEGVWDRIDVLERRLDAVVDRRGGEDG